MNAKVAFAHNVEYEEFIVTTKHCHSIACPLFDDNSHNFSVLTINS
jgi:hypothetical protein